MTQHPWTQGSKDPNATKKKNRIIPAGGERLDQIAASLGFRAQFTEFVRKTDGVSTIYVSLYRPPNACFRRQLGKLEELSALSEEALCAAIAAKFPLVTKASKK